MTGVQTCALPIFATFLYNRFLQLRRHVGFSIPEALGGSHGPVLRNPVAIFTSNRNLGGIFVADEFLVQLFRRFGRES